MKVSLTLSNFPMKRYVRFKEELARHVRATVQVGGEDTVFVTFESSNIAKVQCACIVCDKYQFEVTK